MNEVKHDLEYDSRKKELTHKTNQEIERDDEGNLGEGKINSVRRYKDKEIKKVFGDIQSQIAQIEQQVSKQKDKLKEIPEMTDKLKKFKEKLEKVKKIEDNKNAEEQLKAMQNRLKDLKSHKHRIKEAVGDQLDL